MNVKRAILDALTVVCAMLYFWMLFVICLVASIFERSEESGQQSAGCDDGWPVTLVDNESLNRQ